MTTEEATTTSTMVGEGTLVTEMDPTKLLQKTEAGKPLPPSVSAALRLDWTRIAQELGIPTDKPFSIQVVEPTEPGAPLTLITKPLTSADIPSSATQPPPPPPVLFPVAPPLPPPRPNQGEDLGSDGSGNDSESGTCSPATQSAQSSQSAPSVSLTSPLTVQPQPPPPPPASSTSAPQPIPVQQVSSIKPQVQLISSAKTQQPPAPNSSVKPSSTSSFVAPPPQHVYRPLLLNQATKKPQSYGHIPGRLPPPPPPVQRFLFYDGTTARSRPFVSTREHKNQVAAQRSKTAAIRQQRRPAPYPLPVASPILAGCARTRPFTNAQGNSMKMIQNLFPDTGECISTPAIPSCPPLPSISPPETSMPKAPPMPGPSVSTLWRSTPAPQPLFSVDLAAKKPKLPRKQFLPSSPNSKADHMRKMGYLKASLTCARVRPVHSKSFTAARTRPYNGLRKETNWFYFMIHPERVGRYLARKPRSEMASDPLARTNKVGLLSTEVPLPLQYRGFLQRPPSLYLSRSRIHRIGVFAGEDLIQGRIVMEYRGLVHRWSLCDRREQAYKAKGLGSYMFRLDEPSRGEGQVPTCLDATRWGSVARFINHSCDPNCAAKTITFESERKIVLYMTRSAEAGEELSYNYNMPYEDEKIPCSCGARNCKKTLN